MGGIKGKSERRQKEIQKTDRKKAGKQKTREKKEQRRRKKEGRDGKVAKPVTILPNRTKNDHAPKR